MRKHKNHRLNTILFLVVFSLYPEILLSQTAQKFFKPDLPESYFNELSDQFGKNKVIPDTYKKTILIALSYYPELKTTTIRFRIKNRHTPLMTVPSFLSHFKSKKSRAYVITISNRSEQRLTPILFKNVNFNAQIGVAGHEMAHVSDFSSYSSLQLLQHAIKSLSQRYLDRFEFKTDSICIAHGLGYQLLAWSTNIRIKMNARNWRGPDHCNEPQTTERYMNPATILKKIKSEPIYN